MIFVLSGKGEICTEKDKISFKAGDAILINKNEKYYWNAKCKIVIVCSPAWTPTQHKITE